MRGTAPRQTWVAGVAVEHDGYGNRDLPRFDHAFTIPGVFVQDDVEVTPWLSLTASGARSIITTCSGRSSVLASARCCAADGWTSRLSLGTGFFGPSVLTEETEAAGLSRVTVPSAADAPSAVEARRST